MSCKYPSLLLIASALPALAQAAVTGQFQLGDQAPLKPAVAAAFRSRDQFNPREFETVVMLSAQALDTKKIGQSLDPYTTAINDPATQGDHISLFVHADGTVSVNANVGHTQYVDSSGKIMGEQGALSATCKENTATRVACTVKTTKPSKPMTGPSWTLDVSFDADVVSRPAGKPLAADGGEAGKAFLALRGAVGGNDFGKILALMSPEQAKSYNEDWRTPEENLKSAKEILDARLPKQPKITGGELLADDHVLLEVEGKPFASMSMLYLIDMRRVDGKWVWANDTTLGVLK